MSENKLNEFYDAKQDFSARVGELHMYSYDRPAYMVWDAIMNALMTKGYSQAAAEQWLKSKAARWACDGELGDALVSAALEFVNSGKAESLASKGKCERWAKESTAA